MAAPAFVSSPGFTYIGANTSAPSGNRQWTGQTLVAFAATDTAGTTLNAATYGGINVLPYLVASVIDTYKVWCFVIPPAALSTLTPGNTYSFVLTFSGTTSTGIGLVEYSGVVGDDVQATLYQSTGSTVVDVLDLPAESTTVQYVIWDVTGTDSVANNAQTERDDRAGGNARRSWYEYSTAVEQLGHTLQITQASGPHAHIALTLLGATASISGTIVENGEPSTETIGGSAVVAGSVIEQAANATETLVALAAAEAALVEQATPATETLFGSVALSGSLSEASTDGTEAISGSVFDPINVSGIIACWDVDDAVDSSGASSIPDRSGNGNDVTQGTVAARPAIVSADPDFNAHASLQGATGDYLIRATLTQGTVAQPITKYAVIRTPADVTTNQHIFSGVNGATRADIVLNGARFGLNAGAGLIFTAASVAPNTLGILRAVFDTTSSSLEWIPITGATLSVSGNVGTQSLVGTALMAFGAGTATFLGKGGYFLLYAGVIGATDDAKIKTFLRQRFGLVAAAVAGSIVESATPANETLIGATVVAASLAEQSSAATESIFAATQITGDLDEQGAESEEIIVAEVVAAGSVAEQAAGSTESIAGFTLILGGLTETAEAATEQIRSGIDHHMAPSERVFVVARESRRFVVEREVRIFA